MKGGGRKGCRQQINRARPKKWIVDVRECYEHGHGVATYLARYVRGGPIKNQRPCRFDGKTVSFRISRRGEKRQLLDLPIAEFIRRVLLHVPPTGYRVVRACGLYHQFYAGQLEACRFQVGGGLPEAPEPPASDDEAPSDEDWATEIEFCRVCGFQLEIEAIPRAAAASLGEIPVAREMRLTTPFGAVFRGRGVLIKAGRRLVSRLNGHTYAPSMPRAVAGSRTKPTAATPGGAQPPSEPVATPIEIGPVARGFRANLR